LHILYGIFDLALINAFIQTLLHASCSVGDWWHLSYFKYWDKISRAVIVDRTVVFYVSGRGERTRKLLWVI